MPKKPAPIRFSFTLHGQVPSKANFRFKRWDPRSMRAWKRIKEREKEAWALAVKSGAKKVLAAEKRSIAANLTHRVRIDVFCYKQRADPDNIRKLILDGMEGACFVNDRRVRGLADYEEPDKKGARVEVKVTWPA